MVWLCPAWTIGVLYQSFLLRTIQFLNVRVLLQIFPHNEYFNVIKKIDTYVFKLIKDAKAEYETNRAHIFEANVWIPGSSQF